MGFVEQLVSMVQAEAYVASHEFVLSALSTLVDGHRAALAECRRPEFRLQQLLESRCQQLRDDDACKVRTASDAPPPKKKKRKKNTQQNSYRKQ